VIKEEKFQPRILYVASPSAHCSALRKRETRQANARGVHHHEANLTRNVKGISLN